MPATPPIDRDLFHQFLFRRADRQGRLKLKINDLAVEMGRNYFHLTTVITEMTKEGRLKVLSGRSNRSKTFLVRDPATWKDEAD